MNDLSLYRILAFLPGAVRSALNRLPSGTLEKISELRLRAGNITTVTLDGENRYLTDAGISADAARCVRISDADLDEFLYRLCGGSVKNLVASLSDAGALTEQDIDELRAFLDRQAH